MFLKLLSRFVFGLLLLTSVICGSSEVTTNPNLSTDASLTVAKGNNVSLYWYYQINSPATFVKLDYRCEEISTGTTTTLATKSTANGALVIDAGAPNDLKARLVVNGSQLVITNAQYNDSRMSYHAIITYSVSSANSQSYLDPVVNLTVVGNAFLTSKIDELTVQDNSTITVTERMEGNPWTSLLSQWSHQHWSMYNHGVQLYPYIYEATYQYQQIDRSFCGRSLFFEAMNSNGKSEWRETVILVLFTPQEPENVVVTRTSSCVNVNWVKEDTGLCLLNYTVALKNENAEILYEKFGIGVTEISQCDIPSHHNITSVSVTVQMVNSNSTVSKAVSAPMSGDAVGLKRNLTIISLLPYILVQVFLLKAI